MIYLALGLIMLFLLLIFIVLILQLNNKPPPAPVPVKERTPSCQPIQQTQPRDYRFSDSPLDFKQGWWGADVNFPLSSTKNLPIASYDDSGNYNYVRNPLTGQEVDVEPASACTSNNNKDNDDDHKLIPYMISFLFPQGTKDNSDKPYWSSLTIPPTGINPVNYAPPRLVTSRDNNSSNSSLPAYEFPTDLDSSGNDVYENSDASGNKPDCSTRTNCRSCAALNDCAWCKDTNTCVETDRGKSVGNKCADTSLLAFVDNCSSVGSGYNNGFMDYNFDAYSPF